MIDDFDELLAAFKRNLWEMEAIGPDLYGVCTPSAGKVASGGIVSHTVIAYV